MSRTTKSPLALGLCWLLLGLLPAGAQLPFLEPYLFAREYRQGNLEAATATLSRYGLLLRAQLPLDKEELEKAGAEGLRGNFLFTLDSALSKSYNSQSSAMNGCRFLSGLYGSGNHRAPFIGSYNPLYRISMGLNRGRSGTMAAGHIDYYLGLFEEAEEEIQPLIGYAMAYRFGGDWARSGTLVAQAKQWLEENEAPPFFEACVGFATHRSTSTPSLLPDPILLEEVDWKEWNEIARILFAEEAAPPGIRLSAASALLYRAGSLINSTAFLDAVDSCLRAESMAGLWPTSEPLHQITNRALHYPADEKALQRAARLVGDRMAVLEEFCETYGRPVLRIDELDQILLTIAYLEPDERPDLGFLLKWIAADKEAKGHPGAVMSLIAHRDFEGAKRILPEEGQFFDHRLATVLTRQLEVPFREFQDSLKNEAEKLRMEAFLLRHFNIRKAFFKPESTATGIVQGILEKRRLVGSLSPVAGAEVVIALRQHSLAEPYLAQMAAMVKAPTIPELTKLEDEIPLSWTAFHATRMKGLLIEEDWNSLIVALGEIGALAQSGKHGERMLELWGEFGKSISWTCTRRLLLEEECDFEGMLDFFQRALALGCEIGQTDSLHRAPFRGYGALCAQQLGVEFELEGVSRYLTTDVGRGRFLAFQRDTLWKQYLYHPVITLPWYVEDWRLAETRETFQLDFVCALLSKEEWCEGLRDQGYFLDRLRTDHGLSDELLRKAREKAGELGPIATYLLARDGGAYRGPKEHTERGGALRSVIDRLGEAEENTAVLDEAWLLLAELEKEKGDATRVEGLLEKITSTGQSRFSSRVRTLKGETSTGSEEKTENQVPRSIDPFGGF